MTAANTKEPNVGRTSALTVLELLNDTEVLVRYAQMEINFAKHTAQYEGWSSIANYVEELEAAFDPILNMIDNMFIDQFNNLYDELDTVTGSIQLSLIYRLISGLHESTIPSEVSNSSATTRLQDVDLSSDIPPDECDEAAGLVLYLEAADVLITTAQEGISTARFQAETEGDNELVRYR